MIVLKSDTLTVHVLDPVADRERLGTRYCTGGFIFQVDDAARGPLMAGPTWPDSYNLYDGQGIPDAFQPHLPLAEENEGTVTRVLGIGIGVVDTKANAVLERAGWQVEQAPGWLAFQTEQAEGPWGLRLERRLSLQGRTLRSQTSLSNTGKRHLPFQWYPHPFFPLFPGGECCRISVPVTLPVNDGFEMAPSGFLRMKHLPWKREVNENHFQLLGHAGDRPVSFLQKHAVTGLAAAATDYAPTRLPVWGNGFTFSFEPYYERVLTPGEAAHWGMTYDF